MMVACPFWPRLKSTRVGLAEEWVSNASLCKRAGYTSVYDLEYAPTLCFCSLPSAEELLSSSESLEPPTLLLLVGLLLVLEVEAVAAVLELGMVRVLWGKVAVPELEPKLPSPEWPSVRACCLAGSRVLWRPWVWYARCVRLRIEASRGGTAGHGSCSSPCLRKNGSVFM